ncbi:MAG: hypothetical protein DRJ38_01495 [Thermoprotei archaeon]|nr:MAG: hypothetical protein DRJ38_01495 [Thermoprotei archaeon]
MVRTRCELATKYVIPAVRALVASILVSKYGLTQVEAAKKMGTTQAAISYYLNSKRGFKAITILKKNREILKDIEDFTEAIYRENLSEEELAGALCRICRKIRDISEFKIY